MDYLHDILTFKMLFTLALGYFGCTLILVGFRFFASNGVRRMPYRETPRQELEFEPIMTTPLDVRYREVTELGMVQLEPDENIVTGCGRKGELEEILLVTNRRAFIMTRRAGTTFYAKQAFFIDHLRPIPSSAGMMGNKMILSDGVKTGAIDSPGDRGFLDDAKNVVRELNNLIRNTRIEERQV